jgi:hypothetical protein
MIKEIMIKQNWQYNFIGDKMLHNYNCLFKMENHHKAFLRKKRVELVYGLNTEILLPPLEAKKVISPYMRETINAEKNRFVRNEFLLDHLPRCGPRAFTIFENLLLRFQPDLHFSLFCKKGYVFDMKASLSRLLHECGKSKPDLQVIVSMSRDNGILGFDVIEKCKQLTALQNLKLQYLPIYNDCLLDSNVFNQIRNILKGSVVLLAVLDDVYLIDPEILMRTYACTKHATEKSLLTVYATNTKPHYLFDTVNMVTWPNLCCDKESDRKILLDFLSSVATQYEDIDEFEEGLQGSKEGEEDDEEEEID